MTRSRAARSTRKKRVSSNSAASIWNHWELEPAEQEIAAEIGRLARLRKAEIAFQFRQDDPDYEPVFDLDTDGSFLWEIWFEGYERAVGLQENIYDTLLEDGDEDVRKAITGLVQVSLAARGKLEGMGSRVRSDELHTLIPDLIPALVQTLFRRRHGLPIAAPEAAGLTEILAPAIRRGMKVGRNQPCPCGSGSKYTKCCGR